MNQFGTIFKFEMKNYLKNKAFVGVTLFIVVAIAVVMFMPRILESVESGEDNTSASDSLPVMLVKANTNENGELVNQLFSEAFTDYKVQLTTAETDSIKEQITAGDIECAIVMGSATSYTYYVNNLSMYDMNAEIANEVLKNYLQMSAMINTGMTAEDATDVMNTEVEYEVMSLGKDQLQNYFYTYIMIFALYMVIMLYGQMVATNVATEKSSRAMELLITSAKPTSMMFGKVFSSCLAGFAQIVAIFGSAILFYNLNKEYWSDFDIIASIFDMPVELLGYMLIFFVLGFLVYAFLYGAIGSTVSKLEDINTSVMPLTFIFIAAFIIVMMSMSTGEVDSITMIICSYIPFTSPMAMFTRIAMSTVPWYEIAISIAILIGSVAGIGVVSAKIYRVGVLLYGTAPKLSSIIKTIWKA